MVRRAAVPHILSLSFLRPRQVGVSGVRGDGVGRGPGMAARVVRAAATPVLSAPRATAGRTPYLLLPACADGSPAALVAAGRKSVGRRRWLQLRGCWVPGGGVVR